MSRAEQHALLAFVNSFKPTKKVTAFEQLRDGKALSEVCQSGQGSSSSANIIIDHEPDVGTVSPCNQI
jgi:hypothetical protein